MSSPGISVNFLESEKFGSQFKWRVSGGQPWLISLKKLISLRIKREFPQTKTKFYAMNVAFHKKSCSLPWITHSNSLPIDLCSKIKDKMHPSPSKLNMHWQAHTLTQRLMLNRHPKNNISLFHVHLHRVMMILFTLWYFL